MRRRKPRMEESTEEQQLAGMREKYAVHYIVAKAGFNFKDDYGERDVDEATAWD